MRLTRSVKDSLTRVTAGGAPCYVWPGGGITYMVDVASLPGDAFGSVPTPALVAPMEPAHDPGATMPRWAVAWDQNRSLDDVLRDPDKKRIRQWQKSDSFRRQQGQAGRKPHVERGRAGSLLGRLVRPHPAPEILGARRRSRAGPYPGETVLGSFVFASGGRLMLAVNSGLKLFDPATGRITLSGSQ